MTLSLAADECRADPSLCWSETKSFGRRFGGESVRVSHNGGDDHDGHSLPPLYGVLTCTVTDAQGGSVTRSCRPTANGNDWCPPI
jgi:hypothetical protein